MKLLIKLPSRGRPEQLLKVAQQYLELAEGRVTLLLTLDEDDSATVAQREAIGRLPNTLLSWGTSTSKIHAVNRDLDRYHWNVVLVASDDMAPIVHGYDLRILDQFDGINGTDLCLWCSDGRQDRLCTVPVMGRQAYDKRGHVYHPDYESYFSDDEWTEWWTAEGKLLKVPGPMFRHDHWIFGAAKFDALYRRNKASKAKDNATYLRRKAAGFP